MSDTAQSTVKDFEDELETTGTDDNHSPIRPEAGTAAADSDVTTLDNHSPILPETDAKAKVKVKADGEQDDEGDVTTLDNHSPIAPPGGSN